MKYASNQIQKHRFPESVLCVFETCFGSSSCSYPLNRPLINCTFHRGSLSLCSASAPCWRALGCELPPCQWAPLVLGVGQVAHMNFELAAHVMRYLVAAVVIAYTCASSAALVTHASQGSKAEQPVTLVGNYAVTSIEIG
eukprot:607520-Amphidinium_carterae.1